MLSLLPRRSLRHTCNSVIHRRFSITHQTKMKVVPVPVRQDNYAYLLIDDTTNKAAAVDPYDMKKVQAAAEQEGVQIVANLTTHHHHDHSGGNSVRRLCSLLYYLKLTKYVAFAY